MRTIETSNETTRTPSVRTPAGLTKEQAGAITDPWDAFSMGIKEAAREFGNVPASIQSLGPLFAAAFIDGQRFAQDQTP